MAHFIELSADDLLGSKVSINPNLVAMITPEGFDKTRIAIDGVVIVVKETYAVVFSMLSN